MEKSYHTRSDHFFELHKINIEKYEPDYKERSPKLVKYKGDNFMEDSGGVWNWEMNEEVSPFDREFVESQFRQMSFPKHKQKDEIKITYGKDQQYFGYIKRTSRICIICYEPR